MYVIDEEREELEIQAKYEELIAACNTLSPLGEKEEEEILTDARKRGIENEARSIAS